MVATVVVVMVVVMVFFIVVVIVATVSKLPLVIHVNHTNVQIAQADVQTATVVVVLSSLKKLLQQKQLLRRPRRIRKRKPLQLQLKPNIGFIKHV